MWFVHWLLLIIVVSLTDCSAFLGLTPDVTQKPELRHFTDAQTGTLLDIRMDVGSKKEGESRMNIRGILLELLPDITDTDSSRRYRMPGAHGKYPQLSSGVRKLQMLQSGHFIDMSGAQYLDTSNACWEMVWRDEAAAGVLICGFDINQDYHRNDAVLAKGRLFLSFPIWTREGLDEKQDRKRKYEQMAKDHKLEYERELEKMQNTGNLFMKAWHFRSAMEAGEKYILIPHTEISHIPWDNEIIPVEDGLFLSSKGLVYSKDGLGRDVLLGSALATIGSNNAVEKGTKRP